MPSSLADMRSQLGELIRDGGRRGDGDGAFGKWFSMVFFLGFSRVFLWCFLGCFYGVLVFSRVGFLVFSGFS